MKWDELTPKQESFCVHYTTIGSPTFSCGVKSALEAGYAEKNAGVSACQFLKKDIIWDRIKALQAEHMSRNRVTVDKILSDLEHDKLLARENHRYAVAKGCSELQGKFLSMFVDRHAIKSDEIRELNEIEKAEAQKIAKILLYESDGECQTG